MIFADDPAAAIGVLAAGYLLGSVPFGLVLTRLAGYGDIRQIGSGNIGATNVLRTGNKTLAALTLVLDGGKGAAAVLIAAVLAPALPSLAAIAGAAAVLGHLFPVWLRFRGGKGVATTLGTLLALAWPVGALVCATWLAVAAATRFSSLAALVSVALAPAYAAWLAGPPEAIAAACLAVLVWIRHHENIRRLLSGQEPRIGARKDSGNPPVQ
ncbi:MAG: glycerol-3-phosphate 1-O-acyltransferase PlsY [Alphaproteobacteria bacterium]